MIGLALVSAACGGPLDDTSTGAGGASESGDERPDGEAGSGAGAEAPAPDDVGSLGVSSGETSAGGAGADGATGDDADLCPDGFARGAEGDWSAIRAFDPAIEGIAVCPSGEVFVSQPDTGAIFRVPLDGSTYEVWTILANRRPLGMDCASDGSLYVADFGSDDATVVRVAGKGDPGTPLPKVPGDDGYRAMNGVAVVEGVGVYATDASNTLFGRVILFAETAPDTFEARVEKSGLPFPNDVDFDPSTGRLDLTLTVNSQVFSYPVAPDGGLGGPGVAWSGTFAVDALDGLAVAEGGERFLAHYLEGTVRRSSDGHVVAALAEPRSLAFRGGTLLVTGRDGLYAVELGVCGAGP